MVLQKNTWIRAFSRFTNKQYAEKQLANGEYVYFNVKCFMSRILAACWLKHRPCKYNGCRLIPAGDTEVLVHVSVCLYAFSPPKRKQ